MAARAGSGIDRSGMERQEWRGLARSGVDGTGQERLGRIGMARSGLAPRGVESLGSEWQDCLGSKRKRSA